MIATGVLVEFSKGRTSENRGQGKVTEALLTVRERGRTVQWVKVLWADGSESTERSDDLLVVGHLLPD